MVFALVETECLAFHFSNQPRLALKEVILSVRKRHCASISKAFPVIWIPWLLFSENHSKMSWSIQHLLAFSLLQKEVYWTGPAPVVYQCHKERPTPGSISCQLQISYLLLKCSCIFHCTDFKLNCIRRTFNIFSRHFSCECSFFYRTKVQWNAKFGHWGFIREYKLTWWTWDTQSPTLGLFADLQKCCQLRLRIRNVARGSQKCLYYLFYILLSCILYTTDINQLSYLIG